VHAPLEVWLAEVDRLMRDDDHHARLVEGARRRCASPTAISTASSRASSR
jgi:hypothetical protein